MIWGRTCDKTHTISYNKGDNGAPVQVSIKTDKRGPNCGVIPGTDEARYEWYALKPSYNPSKDFNGLMDITSGGASAQMAIFVPKKMKRHMTITLAFQMAIEKMNVHFEDWYKKYKDPETGKIQKEKVPVPFFSVSMVVYLTQEGGRF